MSIKEQKKIADEVLYNLELISPYAILAGGAPRDWYLGKEANDLDFYFTSTTNTTGAMLRQLERMFGKADENLEVYRSPIYKHMSFLKNIINYTINGMKVQFMCLKETGDEFKVVDSMSVSICKIWYKNSKIYKTNDFKLTDATRYLFLSDGYSWEDPHPQKIMSMFKKGYTTRGTREEVEKALLNKVLREMK